MQSKNHRLALAALAALALAGSAARAAPTTYAIDPHHTYPSFEADHMGISVWRGKFNKTSGTVVFDKATGAGQVDLAVDLASVDFGEEMLNKWARGREFFEVAKYPKARYRGHFEGVADGVPTQVVGEFTLHGMTRPLVLKINSLKCVPHPMLKRELCGADALASFNRDEFGLGAGKDYGFKMDVTLRIQVEALATQ
ncbi:MAG TPA: YceI family protein [Albitalea sp.]|nr:YceI family protein [Albitalea sp.]